MTENEVKEVEENLPDVGDVVPEQKAPPPPPEPEVKPDPNQLNEVIEVEDKQDPEPLTKHNPEPPSQSASGAQTPTHSLQAIPEPDPEPKPREDVKVRDNELEKKLARKLHEKLGGGVDNKCILGVCAECGYESGLYAESGSKNEKVLYHDHGCGAPKAGVERTCVDRGCQKLLKFRDLFKYVVEGSDSFDKIKKFV